MTIPSHIPVDYDHSTHRYSHNGTTYLSATQILSRFKPVFDTEERSQYMADRYGRTPEYWKQKWKEVSDNSLERGNEIHDREERVLYDKKFLELDDLPIIRPEKIHYHLGLEPGVYPELKLWRHDYRIAGRTDKAVLGKWNRRSARIASVEDYKTGKQIRTESYKNRDGSYEMLTGPLSHLMNCEMVIYTLQLSLYQFMLEYHGFSPGHRRIIHFPHEIEGLGTPKPVPYDLPYLRSEVLSMLEQVAVHKPMPV